MMFSKRSTVSKNTWTDLTPWERANALRASRSRLQTDRWRREKKCARGEQNIYECQFIRQAAESGVQMIRRVEKIGHLAGPVTDFHIGEVFLAVYYDHIQRLALPRGTVFCCSEEAALLCVMREITIRSDNNS